MIRIAYILGNLTTNFEEARIRLTQKSSTEKSCFVIITELASYYLEKDANPESQASQDQKKDAKSSKYQEFTTGHLEDALTKIIKLLANLSIEESVA